MAQPAWRVIGMLGENVALHTNTVGYSIKIEGFLLGRAEVDLVSGAAAFGTLLDRIHAQPYT